MKKPHHRRKKVPRKLKKRLKLKYGKDWYLVYRFKIRGGVYPRIIDSVIAALRSVADAAKFCADQQADLYKPMFESLKIRKLEEIKAVVGVFGYQPSPAEIIAGIERCYMGHLKGRDE